MLRGSYAGGSLAVTARCPSRRSGPSAHPACPRPGSSSRTESAREASRSRCRRIAKSRLAGPCPRHSRLCYSSAGQRLSLPSHGKAEQSKAFAFHRKASCRRAIAAHRLGSLSPSVASLRRADPLRRALRCAVLFRCIALFAKLLLSPALSRGASPRPLIAFQSHRTATPRKALPSLPVSVHRRCMPRLCFAVASRCFAPQCRSRSRRLMAELPNASASRLVAGPSRGRSLLCSTIATPRFATLVHCFAVLSLAAHFRRLPEQIKALPWQFPSPQLHRRSTRCCASPSRCRARQILRHSYLRHAAIAIPLLCLPSLLRRTSAPVRAKPSRHAASLGSSVAVHRVAQLSRRYSGSEPSVHSERPLPLLRHWPMPRNCP